MDVKGQRAVVVGGASGMGRATAEALAERGASVAVLDLATSAGAEVAEGLGGTFHPVDVLDAAATEAALDAAVEALGGLTVCVTTAGGGAAGRTVDRDGTPFDLDRFRQCVELNLVGTFNVNRLAAAHMAKGEPQGEDGERGVIVNTSSIAAFEGQIGQVAYTAAKAGIAGMALTMARDLGVLGIRVLAIAPSLFATGITAGIPQERADALVRGTAFPHRMGRPEEYAKLAVAIVENPMLNGQCLRLDAGQRFAPK